MWRRSGRHAGWIFPYRHPAASGPIENILSGIGSVFRVLGVALDDFGTMMQGPNALKETVQPNLAWAPTKGNAAQPAQCGTTVTMPPAAAIQVPHLKHIILPQKGNDVFIAPNANVLGDVKLGDRSSIWYGATLRGDVNGISVGSNTNIQDNVIIHVSRYAHDGKPKPTIIGDNVTIGHGATLHACTIGDNCLVGMGATILDGVEVKEGAIVAAGALVPRDKTIPSGEVWAGSPAKKLRDLEEDELAFITFSALNYANIAMAHKWENGKCFEELLTEGVISEERVAASTPVNSVNQLWVFDSQTMLAVRPKK